MLVRLTKAGDADLNGTVDTVDFNLLASSFSQSGKSWFNGDFDYSGTVDTIDFNLLASNFSRSLPGPDAGTQLSAVVPEPALGALSGLGLCGCLARRRRR